MADKETTVEKGKLPSLSGKTVEQVIDEINRGKGTEQTKKTEK